MSFILSLLLAQAAAPSTPSANSPSATPSDDAKRVCKTITATGSRLGGKRVCMTKLEWRRMNQQNEQIARELQDTYSKQPGPGQ